MSKYRHLTDSELIQAVSTQASYSPIIKELSNRLAIHCDSDIIEECGRKDAECPVCEAQLQVLVDYASETYCLQAQ